MCNDDSYAHELSDGALAQRIRSVTQRLTEALTEAEERGINVLIDLVEPERRKALASMYPGSFGTPDLFRETARPHVSQIWRSKVETF